MAYDINIDFLRNIKISDISNAVKKAGVDLPQPNRNSELTKMVVSLGIDKYIMNMKADKIPEMFFNNLAADPTGDHPEVAEEFDISYYFKNFTAEDFPKFLTEAMTVFAQRSNKKSADDTQMFAILEAVGKFVFKLINNIIQFIYDSGELWVSIRCELDMSFCNAEPKTTKWSMCFICLLAHTYVENEDGLRVKLKDNNLYLYAEAQKMFIEGFKHTFIPKLIFGFFKELQFVRFCFSSLDAIDVNFLPTNAEKLLYLHVDQNSVKSVAGNAFKSAKHLLLLRLDQNQIQNISKDAFDGLESLTFLSLKTNRIKIIDELMFKNLHQLKHLILDENSIESFESGTFNTLTNLQQLSAQDNLILSINTGVFKGLKNLQALKLNRNRISKIMSGTFSEMSKLRLLELNNNLIKAIHWNSFKGCMTLQIILFENNQIKMLAGNTVSHLTSLNELNVINNICVNQTFGNVQDAISQLQLTCDPKPNDCLVPDILNGWIFSAESQEILNVGSFYDDIELVEVRCKPGFSLLIEKTMDNLVACVEEENSSSWNKDFLQCQSIYVRK